MKHFAGLALSFILLVASPPPSQIWFADLTHKPVAKSKIAKSFEVQDTSLPGCEKPFVLSGHGNVGPEDGKLRPIKLSILNVSNINPALRESVQARIRLENTGDQPIEIPWVVDPEVIAADQQENFATWEMGNFYVVVLGEEQKEIPLYSANASLLGSTVSPNSFLKIGPGEWIEAEINFEAAGVDGSDNDGLVGKHEIVVQWDQTAAYWARNGCSYSVNFIGYGSFYKQEQIGLQINIKSEDDEATRDRMSNKKFASSKK